MPTHRSFSAVRSPRRLRCHTSCDLPHYCCRFGEIDRSPARSYRTLTPPALQTGIPLPAAERTGPLSVTSGVIESISAQPLVELYYHHNRRLRLFCPLCTFDCITLVLVYRAWICPRSRIFKTMMSFLPSPIIKITSCM